MEYLTLVPAYGRDYKSCKAVKQDFANGRDFRIADISSPHDGRYCSIRDFQGGDYTLNIRYKRLTLICQIVMKEVK